MSEDVTIRMLNSDEAAVLDRVAPEVFDHEVAPRWRDEFFADPRHHLAVALAGDLVVGMASAVHYVHPDKSPELWINEVGVDPSYQRSGIGRRLLQALFDHGRSLGCREAWLGTEMENLPARGLYASVGGDEQPMVFFTFQLTDEGR